MLLYLSIFLIPLVWYELGKAHTGLGSSKVILFAVFLFFALFIGLGDMQGGYDRYIYGSYFDDLADSIRVDLPWSSYSSEYGYSLFNWLIAHFSQNRYIYILIATLTMYACYYRAFVTYLDDYPLATIVFMGLIYYFTMTYMRQTLAVGFAWQACRYAYERKPVPFFLWVALAFSFHNSAIIFAVMYFIPVHKFSNRTIVIMMIVLFFIGLSPIASWMMNTFGDVTETQSRTRQYTDDTGGYNYGYLLVSIFFAWIMSSNSYLISEDNRKDVFFYNMGLMYCAVLLALCRFGSTGRLGWYYMFGLIYTFSLIGIRADSRTLTRAFIIVLSFVMFYRITSAWNFNLSPYKTFLSNGYPCGDINIYEGNEYHKEYTRDKFYRPAFDFCSRVDLKMVKSKSSREKGANNSPSSY